MGVDHGEAFRELEMRGMRWGWIAAVLVAILLAAAGWRLRDVLAQDACLDAGGAWRREAGRDGACRH